MDINFVEPQNVPQPKDKVKITTLGARPYPDGWRVRVNIDVTPFQERPNLEVYLHTVEGVAVAQLSVIETMHKSMEFTIHIRNVMTPDADYVLSADLYYGERDQVQDHAEARFTIQV